MRVIILAGGVGSRLSEETVLKPKPMVEIGGRPILWHIMMYFSHFRFNHFCIALGYKGEYIKKYMADYCLMMGDMRVNVKEGSVKFHNTQGEDWIVDLIDTGQKTLTGGRLKRLSSHIGNETFIAAWGDGLYNISLVDLVEFHRRHGKLATVAGVRPAARFGHLQIEGDRVVRYVEKPQMSEGWVSGGLFVLEPGVLDYIEGDMTMWEQEPMERLAREEQLMVYRHLGFWQCMDTLRDKVLLEKLWAGGEAPWKVWE